MSQQGFGAGRLETGREKRADTGRVGRGDLGPDRPVVRYQVASRGSQCAAEAVPAAARVEPRWPPPSGRRRRGRSARGRHRYARRVRRRGSASPGRCADGPRRARGEGLYRAGRIWAEATHSMSIMCASREVWAPSACRKAGLSGRDGSSSGSRALTQAGSASVNTTACAVNPMTPESLGDGGGRTVTSPPAGGNRPAAASRSTAASGPCSMWSLIS